MKYKLPLLVGFASLAALVGVHAQSAVTDPVGYITASIAPNAAASPSGADTLVAPTLVQKVEFAGATSAAPTGTALTFASGVPVIAAADANLYYLEIKSGPQAGWWSSLSGASTATAVNLENAVPAGLAANTEVVIRRHNTLSSFLGANSPGLRTIDESATAPDRVIILDPIAQTTSQYVYSTAFFGATPGFYNEVTEDPGNNKIIFPGTGVIIRRLSAGDKNIVSVGYVKTTPTQVDIEKGDNILEAQLATGTTFATSGLDTGSGATGLYREDFQPANGAPDRILLVSPQQTISQFVATFPTAPATHAFINEVTEEEANTTPVLKEGTAFILRRDTSLAAGTWTAPAQVIAP
jgi:uncharacterized protein (TIGR02597 family)